MTIRFEDGSTLDTMDWDRIKSVIKQRQKSGKPKAVEISDSTGARVRLDNLEPNRDAKIKTPEYANYIESTYKEWKIRVWTIKNQEVYGCNYFKSEDLNYIEVPFGDVRDENGVFRYVQSIINEEH